MAEVSNLSHIVNAPANPMELFTTFHSEAKQFTEPKLFLDTMCIASITDNNEILNRNVILRKFDSEGWSFVTERNTKKYKDFIKNPSVAATFLWIYMMNETLISRQVRVTGTVYELDDRAKAEFYSEETLFAKIRSKICECGAPVDWDELKKAHDTALENYQNGKDSLPRQDTYTAMKIIPKTIDYYFAQQGEIADRVKYTKQESGDWEKVHIAA